jgi:exodeoxyribonuclease VII large subunit
VSGNQSRPVYTVSELTRTIKRILEQEFPLVWLTGEISNLSIPASGHHYFTLKDHGAQISAVVFKGPAARLKFRLENGLALVGLGRLSVYAPRGTYQIIFEHLEPHGVGALQLDFEQLKQKLIDEGLFDDGHKKQLPWLPRKVHLITSPTGAVVHDTIRIIQRRFPNMPITLIPASVQGSQAEAEIIAALEILNRQKDAQVAILARGGGSLEDLQPFNSEGLARAIFASKVPIVSAVGHETDVTIADFVADLRASTPSAAAEIVVPLKAQLQARCQELTSRLVGRIKSATVFHRQALERLSHRLRDPQRQIQDLRLRLDDMDQRLRRAFQHSMEKRRTAWHQLEMRLRRVPMHGNLQIFYEKIEQLNYILLKNMNNIIYKNRILYHGCMLQMKALNPLNVLRRGYSITRTLPAGQVVKTAQRVRIDQRVEIQLSSGALRCRVEEKKHHGEENI